MNGTINKLKIIMIINISIVILAVIGGIIMSIDLRSRTCTGIHKVAVIEPYADGTEDAIFPFKMINYPDGYRAVGHAQDRIDQIRMYAPNAEIYLIPYTPQALNYCVDNGIVLISMSFDGWALSNLASTSEKILTVAAVGNVENIKTTDRDESQIVRVGKVIGVSAVDSNLNPEPYVRYGLGYVDTVAIVGGDYIGTSSAAPVIVGLMYQWYDWYFSKFGIYPTVDQATDFIIKNSHDVFDDGWDLKTGYGLFRLPKQFEATVTEFTIGSEIGYVKRYVEDVLTTETIDLLVAPQIVNNRTMVGATDISTAYNLGVKWDNVNKIAIYIKEGALT